MGEQNSDSGKTKRFKYVCNLTDNRREIPDKVTIKSDTELSRKETIQKAREKAFECLAPIFPTEPAILVDIVKREKVRK